MLGNTLGNPVGFSALAKRFLASAFSIFFFTLAFTLPAFHADRAFAESADAPPAQGERFRDALASGGYGPEMIVIPAGKFRIGCESAWKSYCAPARDMEFANNFALAVYETTFDEYDRFLAETGWTMAGTALQKEYLDMVADFPQSDWAEKEADDLGQGRGRRPVVNIFHDSAAEFANWLSQETGHVYRLPSEAEWEYAARAGTRTEWSWGNQAETGLAQCLDCGNRWDDDRAVPVGSFPANPWGLHDMHGNVWEMVQDCYHLDYEKAPADGAPQGIPRKRLWGLFKPKVDATGGCARRVIRGGSYFQPAQVATSWFRGYMRTHWRWPNLGFRVAREISEQHKNSGESGEPTS